MKRTGILAMLALSGVALATLSMAGQGKPEARGSEAAPNPTIPKVHMIAAIAIAESATGGRATEAELESDGERLAYEVEVLVKQTSRTVRVDAMSGEVLAAEDEALEAERAREAKAK